MSDKVNALVIFGATGDLAKLETFPALVGLVRRGVLSNPGEKLYLSLAHTDADIDRVLDASRGAFQAVAAGV